MYEVPRVIKFIITQSRMAVATSWEERGMKCYLMDTDPKVYKISVPEIGCTTV